MMTLTGYVEHGAVKLPPTARVRDGSKVLLVVLGRKDTEPMPPLDPRVEAEDAEFVQACRRSISQATRAEEG
jgi:hypothetical protein